MANVKITPFGHGPEVGGKKLAKSVMRGVEIFESGIVNSEGGIK